METIPDEWIDKLFNCMTEFYGERWTKYFKSHGQGLYRAMWKSGLIGLTYDQIKHALKLCKRSALDPNVKPPHVLEFFRIAKGLEEPYIDYHPKANQPICNPEVQKENMAKIRKNLGLTETKKC